MHLAALALALVLLAAPLAAEAQQAGQVWRIGVLILQPTSPTLHQRLDAFRDGLRAHGWVEGAGIALEYRYAEGKPERLPDLVAELIRLRVDVLVTTTGAAALAAKKATTTIPIVMTGSGDALAQGLAASLARPGGNVTGITVSSPDLTQKQLQLLKQALPRVARVAVIRSPGGAVTEREWREVQIAAPALGLHVEPLIVHAPDDVDMVVSAAARRRADALFVLDIPGLPPRIAEVAAKQRLPTMFTLTTYAQAGGLMAYGPNQTALYRRAAGYVDKILRGAKPADLPVEQPTKFELVMNLKTAKALGLTIPQSLLLRADQVIE
jgi:putative ABC transport system substrate-binding protein